MCQNISCWSKMSDLGIDWTGSELGYEVRQDGAGLDSHDLPQSVQGELVQGGVCQLVQHSGQNIVQRPAPDLAHSSRLALQFEHILLPWSEASRMF